MDWCPGEEVPRQNRQGQRSQGRRQDRGPGRRADLQGPAWRGEAQRSAGCRFRDARRKGYHSIRPGAEDAHRGRRCRV